MKTPPATPETSTARAALSGVAAAGLALGAGELAAGLVRSWRSPIVAVADVVIDRSPPSVTKFGIETFGDNDKVALIVGTLVILAIASVVVGIVARRRPVAGPVAFGAVAALGVAATVDVASFGAAVPSLVAGAAGAGAIIALLRMAGRTGTASSSSDDVESVPSGAGLSRRQFGGLAGAALGVAALAAAGGRVLRDRFSAAASRAGLRLPGAASPAAPAPDAAAFADIDGLTPLYTPNSDFYRIDTALLVPQVPVESWSLTVKGLVDEELSFTFDELVSEFEVVERDITMTCVSNPIGGELVGNARWLGVLLRDVLDRAGVDPTADQIVGRSADDYTCGFPVDAAYDRDAIIAFGMNGEPLPLQHGFPARLVTPGLYGYVSATKWLTEIELATFADFDQYWVPRGYAAEAPIKTMSRIDVPRVGEQLSPGDTVIAGVAWAQTRGISKVELKIDDDDFVETTLAEPLNDETWRQWRHPWTATPGPHRLVVRATDGDGVLQTEERAEIRPDGTAGWQSRLVTVRAA